MKAVSPASKTSFFLLFLVAFIGGSYAQNLSKLSYAELDSLMYIEYGNGYYEKAIPYMQVASEKALAEFGNQDSIYAEYIHNLGFFYYKTVQYEKAESLLLQAKSIRAKTLGESNPSFAQSLDDLASLNKATSRFDKAIALYLQSISIREKLVDEQGQEELAATLCNLALLYQERGNFDKAEPLYLRAKDIEAKILGEDHPDYASSLSGLGALYKAMGNYEKAEPFYLQAISIEAKSLGEEHPDFAMDLNNLAVLYQLMGSNEKAEPLFLQSINIYSKTLGEQHPRFAICLSNLAGLYESMKLYEKAEPLYLQVKDIWAKVLGEDHPHFATSLNNLGYLYNNMKLYKKAEPLYLQAKNIRAKMLGMEHPLFAGSLNNLAKLYSDMGDYKKAELLYLQARDIYAKILGKEHPSYATSLNNLASLYLKMEHLDSALYYCLQSIDALSLGIDSSFYARRIEGDYEPSAIKIWGDLDKFTYYSNQGINESVKVLLNILESYYKKTGDKTKLQIYYNVVQSVMRLNELICNDFSREGDKLKSLATNSDFVLQGIKTAILLNKKGYEQEAFGFAELNKGVLLLDAAKTASAYSFGDLPDSLILQEKALQKKHTNLKASLLEKNSKEIQDSLLVVLNKTNQEIEVFTKEIKHKYPKYLAIKYENKAANATHIQTLLDNKTALLEYVIGDSVVYMFYVDKNKVVLEEKFISSKLLATKIKNLHNVLSNYPLLVNDPKKAYSEYSENAHWFYKNLVAPPTKAQSNKFAKPYHC